ncbi:hypothetical protein BN2127_JRS1_04595 [Bacillus cereus]|nr:hypothetical protein BN2127_JRS1_04595 [Bacillus cereus]
MMKLKKKAIPILLAGGMLFGSGAMITNTASAATFDFNQELTYSINEYELSPADLEKAEMIGALPLDNNQQPQSLVQGPQEVKKVKVSLAKVKAGVKKAWNKLPNAIKKYVKLETVLKAVDKYFANSKTVEELIYKSLKSVVPGAVPDFVIKGAAKIIMSFISIEK